MSQPLSFRLRTQLIVFHIRNTKWLRDLCSFAKELVGALIFVLYAFVAIPLMYTYLGLKVINYFI